MRQSNYFFKNKLHAQLVAIAIAVAAPTKYPRRTTRATRASSKSESDLGSRNLAECRSQRRRIWSKRLLLYLLFQCAFLFFCGQRRGGWAQGAKGGRGSSARFCDLCVRLIHLFAYRFGVFSPPEHTVFLSREHLEKDCRFFNILNLT